MTSTPNDWCVVDITVDPGPPETVFDALVTDVVQMVDVGGCFPVNGMNWRGIWNNSTLYYADDVVTGPDGNTYIATITHPAGSTAPPSVGWDLFANTSGGLPAGALTGQVLGFDGSQAVWADDVGVTLGRPVSFFGAKGDSNGGMGDGTDDTAAMQAGMDWAADNKQILIVGPGIYRITAMLKVKSFTKVYLAPGAKLMKDWGTYVGGVYQPPPSGSPAQMFANAVSGTNSNNVMFFGPGSVGIPFNTPDPTASGSAGITDAQRAGRIFVITGNNNVYRDFTIDKYHQTAMSLQGDNNTCLALTILNPSVAAGCGGIRFAGGSYFKGIGCHVISGDDCLQFVNNGGVGGVGFNQSIYNGVYVGCTGGSYQGRLCISAMGSNEAENIIDMSCDNIGTAFIGCKGFCEQAFKFCNLNSSGILGDVLVDGCTFFNDTATGISVTSGLIYQQAATGPVRGITVRGGSIQAPYGTSIRMTEVGGAPANPIEQVLIDGMRLERGRVNTTDEILQMCGVNYEVRNCLLDAKGGLGVVTTANYFGYYTQNANWKRCRFINIANGMYGISSRNLTAWFGLRVDDCTFVEQSGQTTARAVRVDSLQTGVWIRGNDFSQLTFTNKVNDLTPPGTVLYRDNIGFGPRQLWGAGSPEGVVVGSPGDTYQRNNGASGTSLYVKASGVNTNTGWEAPGTGAGGWKETFTYTGTPAVYTSSPLAYNDAGRTLTIKSVRVSVGGAPASGTMTFDVQVGGASIFLTAQRPQIGVGVTTVKQATINAPNWADGVGLAVMIVGAGTGAAGPVVWEIEVG